MGPTASGKSALAMALADHFGGEIVSVDSAQVFRGMDIGTAKPTPHEQAQVAHHLLDLIEPTASYSAALFMRDARIAVDDIRARGRLPILTGGTMLYFKALQQGLSTLPQADATIRAAIDAQAVRDGWPALHAELARIDPVTAARLPRTDAQRIQRALEVHRLTGLPLSQLQGHREVAPVSLGPTVALALVPADRARLHAAIARRFDAMLAQGLVDELRGLRERYDLSADMPSMRCVGYRQAWARLEGQLSADQLREQGIAATRQLAKRQLTWLRATEATIFDAGQDDAMALASARIRQASESLRAG
ncbi:MAG: tRNA (adenosine(37)-N6)-dimethylallyltransferase MiaA [Betaproteobacteria bacterium]